MRCSRSHGRARGRLSSHHPYWGKPLYGGGDLLDGDPAQAGVPFEGTLAGSATGTRHGSVEHFVWHAPGPPAHRRHGRGEERDYGSTDGGGEVGRACVPDHDGLGV